MARILIVEDEESIRLVLAMHLSLVGHEVVQAEESTQARALLKEAPVDLCVLDIMLPGENGFSLGKDLIAQGIPIIFLTAKTAVSDRVNGLRMGAQDYILKPFEPAELLVRVENILKRAKKEESRLCCGGIDIDFDARRVAINGNEIALTVLEFDLLSMLAKRKGAALSREELLSGVWGWDFVGESRTVDVHIQRLRSKIGADKIETVYKYGYRFNAAQEDK